MQPPRYLTFAAGVLLAACLLFMGGANVAHARGEPPKVRAVHAELRTKLHELAKYCTSAKLFGARYDLYELVIAIWPDDPVARKSNGYTKEGLDWSAKGRKRPRNLKKSGLPTLKAMQAEVADWYLEATADAVAGMDPGDASAWKGRALREAVLLAPAYEELRKRNGEVYAKGPKGKKQWLLVESVQSRKRRPALRKVAKEALKAVAKPKGIQPSAQDEHSSVTWTTALATGRGRILGLPPEVELAQALVNAEATYPVFEEAFGFKASGPGRYTLYVFDRRSKGNIFMAGRPGVTESWLKFVTPLIACWMPRSSAVVVKSPEPEVRLEAAPRQVLGAQSRAAFGITAKQGWAIEGFQLYLVWNLTGTRLINSVRQSQYGEKPEQVDLAKKLRTRGTDWLAEARTLVNGRFAPDLRLLLGKTVNTLTPEDILYSYVFAMYLLEGHKEKLPGFLRAIPLVRKAGYDAVFGEHLGYDVATIQARVKRWLAETEGL
ncbi:MAG: hypothetical protein QNJ90_13220 [Planctomycetota bacterium]|nr:hypothetical protein [Planctomycetota bacterium]